MTLSELVRQKREAAGLSLQELGDIVGLSKGHVHAIENGQTVNIGILVAVRLSIALGASINQIAIAATQSSEKA